MIDKLCLSDKECEYLAKGIAIGSGIGICIGAVLNNVALGFAVGGVLGVVGSFLYSLSLKYKKKQAEKFV